MSYNLDISEYLEGNCFVYVQGNEADIEKYYELVRLSKQDKLILYPERTNRMIDNVCYRPYVKSVITENPWIISSYSCDKVWIIRDGEWQNANQQTYGASVNLITSLILGVHNTIPMLVMGGVKKIEEYKENVKLNKFK